MAEADEERVRDIIRAWASAVEAGDRRGILSRHAEDVLMFDFPNTVRGLDAYAETWDFFYAEPLDPIVFRPGEIAVTAGSDVAFATCEVHCDGTSAGPLDFRLTVGLTKQEGDWIITHEHHSVPTVEERFILDEEE
ncbi:nuclear transport factor 2 family protein [Aquabacter sp. CN5-332]|uniref:YybH family protein n=1 Tax=Aquabacter sp. CN5-332 TaxID=3156608 RepID=UPI0032B6203F